MPRLSHILATSFLVPGSLFLSSCQDLLASHPTPSSLEGGVGTNPQPAIAMPLAMPLPPKPMDGALWVPGSKQFFKDSRAHNVGDIITVLVAETASAKTTAATGTSRAHTQSAGLTNFLNLEGKLINHGIPLASDDLVNTQSNRTFTGNGSTNRQDSLTASIAAVVTQVLPNGLLVIRGQREVMVNYEKQVLVLQGIIRTEDISSVNTIPSSKIAEARIAYSGKGIVDEQQTPQYGVGLIDKILPF
ncbi:MAG: flagellar basal body L-ring protein [Proteobacteria bacterium]|nr:flagellar basal body L-ring protein [Pseudomonadota bacterium]